MNDIHCKYCGSTNIVKFGAYQSDEGNNHEKQRDRNRSK